MCTFAGEKERIDDIIMKVAGFRFRLVPCLLAAIVLGIVAGLVLPVWAMRVFMTYNALFGQFLNFMIPLIIVGLVTPAIADLRGGGGRLLAIAVIVAYGVTIVAGYLSYASSVWVFPHFVDSRAVDIMSGGAATLQPYFTFSIPPLMDIMSALVLSFTVGLGVAYSSSETLLRVTKDFRTVIGKAISGALIPLVPLYIFGIFMDMSASGEVVRILRLVASLVLLLVVLHIVWLVVLYAVAGAVTRRNPFRLLWNMVPAYLTAFGTQSSAATIPVTLRQTLVNGVSVELSSFVIPLYATVQLSGSMLKLVACAVSVMLLRGMPFDMSLFSGFIFVVGITLLAAPGVPGGVVMASLGVLASVLGFNESDQALTIAFYMTIGGLGTACNVTGDCALAMVLDHFYHRRTAVPESVATPEG